MAGNGGYGRAFYSYAAPLPKDLDWAVLSGKGRFDVKIGECILDYDAARAAPDPVDAVLGLLQETYSVAADLAKWDRGNLDRDDDIARAVRMKHVQRYVNLAN